MSNPITSGYKVQSIIPQPPSTLQTADPETEDPQTDFIKLMVAQLQNQDPDKPVDGTALVSQLAQMNAAVAMQRMSWLSSANHAVDTATAVLGKAVQLKDPTTGALLSGTVSSVDYSGKTPQLTVGGKNYPVSAVVRVDS